MHRAAALMARGPVPERLAPRPTEQGNLPALAAAFLGPLSIFLLVFSTGASFLVALPCAVAAIVLGSIGVRRVDRGESDDHRTLARIGRTSGIVGAVLSTLVLVAFLFVTVVLDSTADGLSAIVERVQDEINGVDVPDTPDLNPPDVNGPGGPSGNDSGGVPAP